MKELQEIVNQKIKSMIEDGSIEALIGKNIENTIGESVKEALRSYSDFGKTITEKIKEALQCAGRTVEFPAYNLFIKEVAEKAFIKVLNEEAVTHLTDLIGTIIEPVKKNAMISELFDEIRENCGNEERGRGADKIAITSSEADSGDAIYVKIKTEYETINVSFYNFKHNDEDTWHIGYIREDNKPMTSKVINLADRVYHSISHILFKYYAMQTEFELDEEFEDIDLRDY